MDKIIRAKKALGQHFLVDAAYCRRIVDFADLQNSDSVIEIGPGTGRLTRLLLDRGAQVTGIEVDRELIQYLSQEFAAQLRSGQFRLFDQDALQIDWSRLSPLELPYQTFSRTGPTVKVIGNLPYNIATRIIRMTCEVPVGFQSATFMTQKEVADRILASPGGRDYGYLSVLAEYRFRRQRGFDIPPGAFRPRPKVVSHVFQLLPRPLQGEPDDFARLDTIAQWAFRHRRKTLWNNLLPRIGDPVLLEEALGQAGIDRRARPESVTLDQFLSLGRVLSLAT